MPVSCIHPVLPPEGVDVCSREPQQGFPVLASLWHALQSRFPVCPDRKCTKLWPICISLLHTGTRHGRSPGLGRRTSIGVGAKPPESNWTGTPAAVQPLLGLRQLLELRHIGRCLKICTAHKMWTKQHMACAHVPPVRVVQVAVG
jgi:hypothetical protein